MIRRTKELITSVTAAQLTASEQSTMGTKQTMVEINVNVDCEPKKYKDIYVKNILLIYRCYNDLLVVRKDCQTHLNFFEYSRNSICSLLAFDWEVKYNNIRNFWVL